MKPLTQEKADAFTNALNKLAAEHGVLVTAHVIHRGYGADGLAAHCVSNAPNHGAAAAQCEEALGWYRDGKFREHTKN